MADFSSFTREEFAVILTMFDELGDYLRHYPAPEYLDEEQRAVFYSLLEQFYRDAKTKGMWWAR